jgi:DNA-binding MarR family transcriptional regulator
MIWLLRRATRRYRAAVRRELDGGGFGDLAQPGFWVLDAVGSGHRTSAELVVALEITKQAVSQLVESMVRLGYLERRSDPGDRRRVLLHPTQRGTAASKAMTRAVQLVELDALQRIGADTIGGLRAGLRRFVMED